MGKYLKKSCSFYQAEQCLFKFVPKYVIRFSRRHCQKSKMAMLGLNELIERFSNAGNFYQRSPNMVLVHYAAKKRSHHALYHFPNAPYHNILIIYIAMAMDCNSKIQQTHCEVFESRNRRRYPERN
jgi:hypothetical protein